jgi:hypothetical protein
VSEDADALALLDQIQNSGRVLSKLGKTDRLHMPTFPEQLSRLYTTVHYVDKSPFLRGSWLDGLMAVHAHLANGNLQPSDAVQEIPQRRGLRVRTLA